MDKGTIMKRIFICVMFFASLAVLTAESVDKAELFKVKKDSVEFLNYEGPHTKFETAAQIRGIGGSLGKELKKGSSLVRYFDKYSIQHIIDKNGNGLLNADIFSIEKNAVVDHIDNVRRILSGYLEIYYTYSKEDAGVIAEFITYYNAYYRKNIDYFKTVYAGKVIAALNPDKAGISTRYMDWPGKTQMLIPLLPKNGNKVNIDTVSNKDVIQDLRTKKNKGIEPRKAMVEVKEKEISVEQKKIEEAKKALEEEKKSVEVQKKAEEKAAGTPAGQKAIAETARKETEIKQQEQNIKKRETENNKRQAAVQQEREQIAKDEKQLIEQNKTAAESGAAAVKTVLPFLFVNDSDPDLLGRFVLADDKTGSIAKRSSLNTVRGRTFLLIDNSLFFIAGIDKPPKAIRLMRMNKDTLEIEQDGKNDIYAHSVLVLNNASLYAITRIDGKWYVGRFNTKLELLSRSSTEVLPFTPLQFDKGKVYVETKSGTIRPLNAETLQPLP